MSSQELALRINELRTIILFLIFVGFGILLMFGKEIVDALWFRSKDEYKEKGK